MRYKFSNRNLIGHGTFIRDGPVGASQKDCAQTTCFDRGSFYGDKFAVRQFYW